MDSQGAELLCHACGKRWHWRYIPLGKAKLTHDIENGFTLEGFYRGQKYYVNCQPAQPKPQHAPYPLNKKQKPAASAAGFCIAKRGEENEKEKEMKLLL